MEKRERHVPMRATSDYLLRQSAGSPLSQQQQPSIRERLEEEMRIMQAQMERFKLDGRQREARSEQANFGSQSREQSRTEQEHSRAQSNNQQSKETSVINPNRSHNFAAATTTTRNTMSADRESTPLSSAGSTIGDPLAALSGSNRATTTERRTTTTTTTKRTVKSSDDFIPTATDIQQVRSESRTGSISSSAPIYSAGGTTTTTTTSSSGTGNLPQQQQSSSSSSSSTHTTTSTSKQQGNSNNASKTWSSSTAAADGLQSPLIQDTEEGRVLKLRFDVTQYEPDEIVVKTVDNRLTVQAKHEERSENRSVYREYNREFHLPDGTDVEQIRSSLSKDGVLTVDCPLPSPQLHGASRRIPIEKV